MTWVLIGVGVGVAAILTTVALRKRVSAGPQSSSEQLTILGTTFIAVGGGTIPTLGFVMLGMVAIGLVLIVVAMMQRRNEEAS